MHAYIHPYIRMQLAWVSAGRSTLTSSHTYVCIHIHVHMNMYICVKMQVNLDVVDVPPDSSGGDCRCERGFYGRTCQKSAEIRSSQSLELTSAAVLYICIYTRILGTEFCFECVFPQYSIPRGLTKELPKCKNPKMFGSLRWYNDFNNFHTKLRCKKQPMHLIEHIPTCFEKLLINIQGNNQNNLIDYEISCGPSIHSNRQFGLQNKFIRIGFALWANS